MSSLYNPLPDQVLRMDIGDFRVLSPLIFDSGLLDKGARSFASVTYDSFEAFMGLDYPLYLKKHASKYGLDKDFCRFLKGFNWIVKASLVEPGPYRTACLRIAQGHLMDMELRRFFQDRVRKVGVLTWDPIGFRQEIERLQFPQFDEYHTKLAEYSETSLRIKICSEKEYLKALAYVPEPLLFGIKDTRTSDFYMFQWSMYADLESLFYKNKGQPGFKKKVIKYHLEPAIDRVIIAMTHNRQYVKRSKPDDFVKIPVTIPVTSPDKPMEAILELGEIDFARALRCRLRGGVEGGWITGENNDRYTEIRLGEEKYDKLAESFVEFCLPLNDSSQPNEAILPTLYLGDILPLGYIIDADSLCVGNPWVMISKLLSHPLLEESGVKKDLKEYALATYEKTLPDESKRTFHEQYEIIYKRAEAASAILSIGSHYMRYAQGVNPERNLADARHYLGLALENLIQLNEKRLFDCLVEYIYESEATELKSYIENTYTL